MPSGGKRAGAGRKTVSPDRKREPVSVRLLPCYIAALDSTGDSRAYTIERALEKYFEKSNDEQY